MERIVNRKFKMPNHSASNLIHKGFRPIYNTDEGDEMYKYSFTMKPRETMALIGEIFVSLQTGEVTLQTKKIDGSFYAPFTNPAFESQYKVLLSKMDRNFEKQLKYLGAEEVKKNAG